MFVLVNVMDGIQSKDEVAVAAWQSLRSLSYFKEEKKISASASACPHPLTGAKQTRVSQISLNDKHGLLP